MFGNEFARGALMNTHAVQKNKGESGGDTRCDVLVCVTFFCCKHLQRVPEEELKVAKTSEILDGLSSRN